MFNWYFGVFHLRRRRALESVALFRSRARAAFLAPLRLFCLLSSSLIDPSD